MSDRICGHCGGELNGFGFAGGFELCHTSSDPAWKPPMDCYRLVTVYQHKPDGTCCRIQWRGPENCEEVFFMLGWDHEGVDQDDHSVILGLGPDGNDTARWGDTIVRRGDYWAVLKESGWELWKAYQDSVEAGQVVVTAPPPSKDLVVWHDWPNCFKEHCIECVWWDICWILAEHGIYTRVPWG